MSLLMRKDLVFGLLVFCCGCGSDGVQQAAVSGKVTLDGVEITEGLISFCPCGDAKGPVAGGIIKDGHYSIAAKGGATVGSNRVEIKAPKKTGRQVPVPGLPNQTMPEYIKVIPKRYNTQSTLTAEIKPGNNVFVYDLTSK